MWKQPFLPVHMGEAILAPLWIPHLAFLTAVSNVDELACNASLAYVNAFLPLSILSTQQYILRRTLVPRHIWGCRQKGPQKTAPGYPQRSQLIHSTSRVIHRKQLPVRQVLLVLQHIDGQSAGTILFFFLQNNGFGGAQLALIRCQWAALAGFADDCMRNSRVVQELNGVV